MYNYLEQVSVDTDTGRLVDMAGYTNYKSIDRLIGKETELSWWRRINFFYKVTSEVENYLQYTSLPYCLRIGTGMKMTDIWPHYPFIEHLSIGDDNRIVCLPTGNVRPRYMIVGDAQGMIAPSDMFLNNLDIVRQGYFERAWSRGFAARVLRGALAELHIHTDVWYSTLLKLCVPSKKTVTIDECRKHLPMLINEIDTLKPEVIILIGRNTATLATSLGLPAICEEREIQLLKAYHPLKFRNVGCNGLAHKMYANHLYDILF